MPKPALLCSLAGLSVALHLTVLPVLAQESSRFGGRQSTGLSATYSPDSSHILIGDSEQRRVWTTGLEYTHLLHAGRTLRLDYEGSVIPFFQESDPTLTGTITTINKDTFILPQAPVRVVAVTRNPVGYAAEGRGAVAPIYATYGRQTTYAAALSPIGLRIGMLPRSRIQPGFAIDLGFVVSTRDLPVDLSDQFNYMFSLGPGIQLYATPRQSLRLEYLYRHLSNAHQGFQNPGIDQGVIRLTLSRHR